MWTDALIGAVLKTCLHGLYVAFYSLNLGIHLSVHVDLNCVVVCPRGWHGIPHVCERNSSWQ